MKSTSKKGSDLRKKPHTHNKKLKTKTQPAFLFPSKFWPTLNCLVRQQLNSVEFQLNSASDTGIKYQCGKSTRLPLPVSRHCLSFIAAVSSVICSFLPPRKKQECSKSKNSPHEVVHLYTVHFMGFLFKYPLYVNRIVAFSGAGQAVFPLCSFHNSCDFILFSLRVPPKDPRFTETVNSSCCSSCDPITTQDDVFN